MNIIVLNHISFHSSYLDKKTSLNVFLPNYNQPEYPILYLLHGWSDDCNAWINMTSLLRYAEKYSFIIVMPEVDLSYYTNTSIGERYFDFLSEELPSFIEKWFPVDKKSSKRFVAGLSMGGYGAFKWALTFPECFRAVASFSGAVDVVSMWESDFQRSKQFERIFGNKNSLIGSNNDLNYLVQTNYKKAQHLNFYQSCGTEDFLYSINNEFYEKNHHKFRNYDYITRSGEHNWHFWDQEISDILDIFNEML